jgi:tetratricopeptide (TPR) repeat protein
VEGCIYYGRFLLASGDTAKAEEVLSKGYALAHQKGSALQELNLLPLLCELHVHSEDLGQAEQDLERAQEILACPQPWRGLAAPVHLAEGILATARGNWPEAERAFGEALEVERTHGFLYHEARVMVAWGEMHLKRDAPGDRERGMELLDQALAIFQRCAATKDVEKVLGKKGLLGA